MFTGLVEDIGTLVSKSSAGVDVRLEIATSLPKAELTLGESIAVNGCCLTLTGVSAKGFSADASAETLERTSLGALVAGQSVHLERALAVGGRLGGHFVLGHVDGVGILEKRSNLGRAWDLWIRIPEELAGEMIEKGSIAIDGVSLTINEVRGSQIRLTIVPHTAETTLLISEAVGRKVNLETDVLGKYVKKFVAGGSTPGRLENLLEKYGYTGAG